MSALYKIFAAYLISVCLVVTFFSTTVNAQYDSADGHGGGGDSGAAYSGGIDQTDDKSASNGDFTSNDDFSGGSDDNAGNSDFGDFSSGDENNGGGFSDLVSTIDPAVGLGNEAGAGDNPGAPSPLSNQNHTVDSTGAIATGESSDTGYSCENVNCDEPLLSGTTSCIGSVPVVNLSWSGSNSTNVRYWHIVRAQEPNPTFSQLVFYWFTDFFGADRALQPNKIYYYAVFGSNSGNGTSYSARTPLSDILAVYTRSCAPVINPVCSNTNPGTIEDFSVSWLNNEPLASGYRLYRGTNGNVASRTYMPPNHAATVNNYTDGSVAEGTPYNYWFTSYRTVYHPAWTEITSTDENGNPTGSVEHPAYYEDVESAFSGMSASFTPSACTEPVQTLPIINLSLTTPLGTFTDQDLPASVKEGEAVVLNWTIQNATSATASSLPQIAQWQGSVNPISGSVNIPTGSVGTYVFNLSATDGTNTEVRSIQLNVNLQRAPFIQTTGGDVHTNEDIYISPP